MKINISTADNLLSKNELIKFSLIQVAAHFVTAEILI